MSPHVWSNDTCTCMYCTCRYVQYVRQYACVCRVYSVHVCVVEKDGISFGVKIVINAQNFLSSDKRCQKRFVFNHHLPTLSLFSLYLSLSHTHTSVIVVISVVIGTVASMSPVIVRSRWFAHVDAGSWSMGSLGY